ncbi:HAMP domain-containing protein [Heliobacterium gestii]|uniref:HAMP domain-containing protein n=1 Tax=Heliomicrobium gestii TaxID=2699 RepID=A0A845LCT9_HELGE|nr:methyl-accepting chemotaxis protein [Heliomicrobium gestii]MBM7868291.1 methyl-accepting chemotaxis protein [Heliomicrobium gestii]MZP44482.1 HAMP domain-containing protein [Heliomicrobium gestii]
MGSIQKKLITTVLVMFLISLSALGGLNYWEAKQVISAQVEQEMAEMATNGANDIGDWFESRKAELHMLASTPVLESGDKAAIAPNLVNADKDNDLFDGVAYASPDGALITSTGVTSSVTDRGYFQEALRGESVISDPLVNKVTNRLVSVIAVPVKVDGRVTGVLIGNINMEDISKRVLAIKVGQSGYALVAQRDGLTIIHPDPEVAMKANPLTDPQADPGRKAITERLINGGKGIEILQAKGVERYYAYAPVPGLRWALAVTVPVSEVTGQLSRLTIISVITTVVVLVLAGAIFAWYARRIAKPIQMLEMAANRIAAGELAVTNLEIDTNDEIGRLGQSFEQMAHNLRSLIVKVNGATEQVATSAELLTASSDQSAQAAQHIANSIITVSTAVDEQLGATNETASVVEEISASIQQVAANVNQVSMQSGQAAERAQRGAQAVSRAVSQMGRIEETVNSSAKVVAKLGERSKEIGQIVDAISGIAGQTNLLALNAAIEAARAGEQGRGFAVVAEEVRKLAEQSQEAAQQIAQLIGEIQSDTGKAVSAMNEGTQVVKTGAEMVNDAGAAFQEIASLVTDVSEQVKVTSVSIQEIASGSQQIVGSVKRIDDLSRNSAGEAQTVSAAAEEQLAAIQEITASSHTLANMVEEMKAAIGKFSL